MSAKTGVKIIILIIVACMLCTGLVWLNAYSSKLQYEISTINNKIQQSEWDIRDLEVSLRTKTNITNIEAKAVQIGMTHPSFSDMVYLRSDADELKDFALAIKENTYR